ncbi:unnamed protein product [Pleuronectes platessa]|uniref:Uncharacterized protein n=1 Tax=Pleuronectes platessa TaxID=8262 RepID=A0A9N7VAD9_PLEPL|nr:unnamed protein product [Pleuronectes platessa]
MPRCSSHAGMGRQQILDFPHKPPPAGLIEDNKALNSPFNPLHRPYSSTSNYKPDVAKARPPFGLSVWARGRHRWQRRRFPLSGVGGVLCEGEGQQAQASIVMPQPWQIET